MFSPICFARFDLAVQQEKTHQNLLSGVEHFDKTTMKHAQTSEKIILPNTEVIEQEKAQSNLLSGIENFDSTKLKHAETQEKNPLPTKEVIDQEKSA
ncbi:hypothetical protein YQE_09350, partial [Dendroctonus ponderosae]